MEQIDGVTRRVALEIGAVALAVVTRSPLALVKATPDQAGPDAGLMADIELCLTLDALECKLMNADTEDKGSPEIDRVSAKLSELTLKVRQTPALTLAGIVAKAKLYDRIADPGDPREDGFASSEHPMDPDVLALSICKDLARFAQSLPCGCCSCAGA